MDSGSTAAFTGAKRGSRRSTVRVSTPPLEFGASSSEYASTRKAISERVSPHDGSITYGVYRSPEAWSKYCILVRSEERRVGKECKSLNLPYSFMEYGKLMRTLQTWSVIRI